MGLFHSKQSPVQETPVALEIPKESSVQSPVYGISRKHVAIFWATPVFLYNSTVPKDGYTYRPVYPVEPFRAQQYTITVS
jgi:hypothetical protein